MRKRARLTASAVKLLMRACMERERARSPPPTPPGLAAHLWRAGRVGGHGGVPLPCPPCAALESAQREREQGVEKKERRVFFSLINLALLLWRSAWKQSRRVHVRASAQHAPTTLSPSSRSGRQQKCKGRCVRGRPLCRSLFPPPSCPRMASKSAFIYQ